MKLKLVVPGQTGRGARIYLDDKELESVYEVTVNVCVEDMNKATITFYPTEVEVEGEFGVKRGNKTCETR